MQSPRIANRPGLLLSASLVALALVAAPLTIDHAASDFGMAKVWAKNGNGNGGGHGNGNGNGHGNGNANGHDKTANAKSGGSNDSDDDADVEDDDTASASELGSLNAAHASPTALANASPNSRVGKIAAYKEAALDAMANDPTVADAQADLDAAKAAAVADSVVTADEQAQIDALEGELDAAKHAAIVGDDESMAALDAAANKPVTDRVIDTVNDMLGIN
jgi:type II secretory pathway component HofQ